MKHHPRNAAWIVALLIVWGASSGCDVALGLLHHDERAKANETWTKTYPLAGGGQVEVTNVNGRIEVVAWDGTSVEVKAERIAKAATEEAARELLKELEIREDVASDRVRLETHHPRRRFSNTEVRYSLRVPRTAVLKLRTVNGGIEVDGVKGGVSAETTNGGVEGRNLAKRVEATATNGGITIGLDSLDQEPVDIETTNGGITLTLPSEARADLSAQCVNGGIDVSGLALEPSEMTRRRVSGRLNGGGTRIELKTVNGGIRISAKSSAG